MSHFLNIIFPFYKINDDYNNQCVNSEMKLHFNKYFFFNDKLYSELWLFTNIMFMGTFIMEIDMKCIFIFDGCSKSCFYIKLNPNKIHDYCHQKYHLKSFCSILIKLICANQNIWLFDVIFTLNQF